MITIVHHLTHLSLNGRVAGRAVRLAHNRLVHATSASNHWSATEYNQNNAWNVNFSNGNFNNNNKYNNYVVRAVAALTDDECQSIIEAYIDCCRHKKTSMQCTLFRIRYAFILLPMLVSILDRSYKPGTSVVFIVTRPKYREVFAANFADRVVQHWVTLRIEPLLERRFIDTGNASYNCRKHYGTLQAVRSLRNDIRIAMTDPYHYVTNQSVLYVIKLDIRSFFMSIDTDILLHLITGYVNINYCKDDKDTLLFLLCVIIRHRPELDCTYKGDPSLKDRLPPHKSLFNVPKNIGLAIGNITSQLLANFYLTPLDRMAQLFCAEHHCRYKRFVDDFYMIGHKSHLLMFHSMAEQFLSEALHLKLHADKVYIQPIEHGITFVGSIVNDNRVRLIPRTFNTLIHAASVLERTCATRHPRDKIDDERMLASINSILGFTVHTNDYERKLRLFSSLHHMYKFYDVCRLLVVKRNKQKKII